MANTERPFITFKTEEEFNKHCDQLIEKGRISGFKDGSIWTLSYIYELLQDLFKPEAFVQAEEEIRQRNIEEWRKTNEYLTLKQKLDLFGKFGKKDHE